MKYIDFINTINEPVFSLQLLRLMNINVYPYQLTMWSNKGYIAKLKNGIYVVLDKKNKIKKEHIAYRLYEPSYISLEWALSLYGLIPEMVFNVTSVTTKTTRTYNNKLGLFIYRHIKKTLFIGYKKIDSEDQPYLIATPEKALIDYIYLNSSKINNESELEELRLNMPEIKKLDYKKIKEYGDLTGSSKVNKIIKMIYVQFRTNKK